MSPIPLPDTAPPARTRPWKRFVGSDAGFTLIEVLVTALIVILLASATAGALIATSAFSGDQRERSQADSLASQDQERLRGLSDQQLNALNQSRPVTLGGTSFTVLSTAGYVDTTGATTCTSTAASSYKLTSKVSWTEHAGHPATSVIVSSVVARPVTGDLLTQVTDQTGQGLPGVVVKATGTSTGTNTQTSTTDSNGCVLFAGLGAGTYTVAATPTQTYVDPNGSTYGPAAPLSSTATVTATGSATPVLNPFVLGQPGTITGTFTTTQSGSAGAEADGLSWSGSGASTSPVTGVAPTPATGVAPSFTASSLFPFDKASTSPASYTGNYTVWGGRCAGQLPPTANQTVTSVAPGGAPTPTVAEPFLYVGSVTWKNGYSSATTVKPADVRLTYSSGGCTDDWPATLTTVTSPMPTTGWLTNAEPYAASGLTVCADYKSGSTYYRASVAATNTSFTTKNTVSTIAITSSSSTGRCT